MKEILLYIWQLPISLKPLYKYKYKKLFMKDVIVVIERSEKNLSAYVKDAPIIAVGNNIEEIKTNIIEAVNFYLEDNANPCETLSGEFELVYKEVF